MITIENLKKSYSAVTVFEKVNLKIEKGLIVGLLGANGSGKTTLQNIIINKTDFDGKVLMEGIPNYKFIEENRNDILYLPDKPFVYEFLTGMEFLKFVMEIRKINFNKVSKRIDLLLNLFNLDENKDRLIKEYSHGMKHKISLISVLVLSPQFLLLDEPVAGLDTTSIIVLKKVLKSLANEGTTIIFSTHILDLVENLCDDIVTLYNKKATLHKNIKQMNRGELEKFYLNIIGNKIDLDNLTKF